MALRRSIAIFATATAAAGALHFQFACAGTKREMVEHPTAVEGPQRPDAISSRAKNAILFVGDGMGISTVTAARILEGQLRGESGEENQLSFDRFPDVALIKVYNTNQQTPDSSGTMTAIVTGEKTRAGVVSVDASVDRGDFSRANAHRLETIVEIAEDRGLSTGLVTTTSVTHATPRGCRSRRWAIKTAPVTPVRVKTSPKGPNSILTVHAYSAEQPRGDRTSRKSIPPIPTISKKPPFPFAAKPTRARTLPPTREDRAPGCFTAFKSKTTSTTRS
jgi:hypothetical protein